MKTKISTPANRKSRQGSVLVYQLVGSMTADEKRFFKIYAQKYDKQESNLYLLMFNAINAELLKGNTVTDELVKKRVKGLAIEKYFTSAKNKLKKMLCDALFEMNSRHSEDFSVYKEIAIAGIIHNKGFAAEGTKLMARAMEMALEKDYFAYWLEAMRHQVNYSAHTMADNLTTLQNWNEQSIQVHAQLADYMSQIFLNRISYTAYVYNNGKIDTKTKKALTEQALLANVEKAKSIYARYLALNALVFYYHKNYQRNKLTQCTLKQKDLLQSILPRTKRYLGEFFVAYQNYLNSLNPNTSATLIIKGSRDMENLAATYLSTGKNREVHIIVVSSAVMIRLNTFIGINNRTGLAAEVQNAVKQYKELKPGLPIASQIVFQSLIKDTYFMLGKYNEALKWVKMIKKDAPAGMLNHRKLCNLYTELMIIIDTNATVNQIRSAEENLRHFINKVIDEKLQQDALLILLKGIVAVSTARNKNETTTLLTALENKATAYKKSKDGVLRNIVSESNVLTWIEQKNKLHVI